MEDHFGGGADVRFSATCQLPCPSSHLLEKVVSVRPILQLVRPSLYTAGQFNAPLSQSHRTPPTYCSPTLSSLFLQTWKPYAQHKATIEIKSYHTLLFALKARQLVELIFWMTPVGRKPKNNVTQLTCDIMAFSLTASESASLSTKYNSTHRNANTARVRALDTYRSYRYSATCTKSATNKPS
jgi:hypothetical protein